MVRISVDKIITKEMQQCVCPYVHMYITVKSQYTAVPRRFIHKVTKLDLLKISGHTVLYSFESPRINGVRDVDSARMISYSWKFSRSKNFADGLS